MHGGLGIFRVFPCQSLKFQMSSKLVYDDDDYSDVSSDDYSDEIAQDNINALQSHGWHEGQACLLYVHPDGTLGHCNPIVNLPYILMGTALVVLILYHVLNTIHRLYRRKSNIRPPPFGLNF